MDDAKHCMKRRALRALLLPLQPRGNFRETSSHYRPHRGLGRTVTAEPSPARAPSAGPLTPDLVLNELVERNVVVPTARGLEPCHLPEVARASDAVVPVIVRVHVEPAHLVRRRSDRPLIPAAPREMVSALGALDRKLYIVPSQGLVVVRLGNIAHPASTPASKSFDEEFWRRLSSATGAGAEE